MKGFKDLGRGNHFFKLIEILDFHKTEYFILENVDTIKKHDKGNTFKVIVNELKKHWISYKLSDNFSS